MKYLLVKALLGFGDRLEYLLMCVNFVKKYNYKICIDWSDHIWSHGSETFEKYFSLDVDKFEISDIDDSLSIYPAFWKGRLSEKVTHEMVMENNLEQNVLVGPYDCDLLVATSFGNRFLYKDISFFANNFKVIDPRISEEVKRRQSVYKLKDKWCIHLRGTDRFKTKEFREQRFQQLYLKMIHHGLLNHGAGCVVVSDDEEFVKLWMKRDKDSQILSSFVPKTSSIGLHQIDSSALTITKDQMNVNMLIDFFTLASCKQVFSSSNDSRFARLSEQLKPYIYEII
jgi:uncharacterized LabA/DUF88 family protein